ncbi:MAG: DUF447 domain-containing protein [Candidatus Eutrophobiaceae bacterium]
MNKEIFEVIVTTCNVAGDPHIAPMGVRRNIGESECYISPFRPSATLNNLLATGLAVVNEVEDVRIFAGCLTGRSDWPLVKLPAVQANRLQVASAHQLLQLEEVDEDELRPCCRFRVVSSGVHRPFSGFNRARAAVLEMAILISRLEILPIAQIEAELEHLKPAIDKTAGAAEWEAWGWLMEKYAQWHAEKASAKT